MSKRPYSTEKAFQILSAPDESNVELSLSDSISISNSDSEFDVTYEPAFSSATLSDSEEEDSRPAKRRRSGEEAVPSTSTAVPSTSTAVPSASTAVPSASTTVQKTSRTHASLPYALQNPLWLPPNSGEANIPPLTAQPGVQVDTENFAPIDFFN